MKTFKIAYLTILLSCIVSCEKEELIIATEIEDPIEETNGMARIYPTMNLDINLEGASEAMGGFAEQNMTLFKGNLWLVGGDNRFTPPWKSSSQVWASKNGTDWKLITKGIFAERRNHSLLAYKNKLWLIGGINNANEILSDIWNSADGVHWNRVTSLNPLSDIGQNSSVVFNNKIFVFKGNGTEQQEVWSTTNGSTWNLETQNAFPVRSHYETVTHEGVIYVIGGWLRSGSLTNEVWASSNGRDWNKRAIAGTIFEPRLNHSATVYDGKVWVIGGESWEKTGNRTFYGDIWYSENMKYWTKYDGKPPFYKGLHSHYGVTHKNKLWIFGGYRPDASMASITTNKIWSLE